MEETFQHLDEIARHFAESRDKVTLLYSFNGTGKTRLSMEFKNYVNENVNDEVVRHVFYYNAFTEDLFSWDNDLENDIARKLKMDTNSTFFELIKDQGDVRIANKFKEFTNSKIEPNVNFVTGEVTFSLPTGDENFVQNVKISKGEESTFIWTTFFVLMETIVDEISREDDESSITELNNIRYIFIDDPVSSLDDNYIIHLAISLKELITNSTSDLRFIITTHHALFFNVLYNEFNRDNNIRNKCKFLSMQRRGEEFLIKKQNDSPFGYHLFIKNIIKDAIASDSVEKYHFMLFRNLLEKTASFLGYNMWGDLLDMNGISEEERKGYIRFINLASHNRLSDMEASALPQHEKRLLENLFNSFMTTYRWKE